MTNTDTLSPVRDVDFADPAFLSNPWRELLRLQREAPVFWSEKQRGWIITRHADVKDAYADRRLSSARVEMMFRSLPADVRERLSTTIKYLTLNVNRLDGRDHMRIRALMMKAFTPAIIKTLTPTIDMLVDRILARTGAGQVFDFVQQVSAVLPTAVIQHMLGVPDSYQAKLFGLASAFTAATGAAKFTPELMYGLDDSIKSMNVIFNELIADREKNPRDDMISALVHARDGLARLSHEELLACFHSIIVAGAETTAHILATQLVQLVQNDHLQTLVTESADQAFAVVTELLRYPGTVKCMARLVVEDFTWHNQEIHKGDIVWMMNAGANVDPDVFADAFTIDAARDNRNSMAFGPGLHHCIGHLLTRIELSTFFAKAFQAYDIEIPEQVLEFVPSFIFHGYKALNVRLTLKSE